MKSLKYITIAGLTLLVLTFNSCSKEFLDRKPTTAVNNDEALTSVTNVQSATVGLMLYFASYGYTGRNLPVVGDLITDNVTTIKGNSGHLLDIERWNISSSLGEVSTFWGGSYQVISAAAKVVEACEKLYDDAGSDAKKTLDRCKATALTVKVFAEYILTQYYCLPYSAAEMTWPISVGTPDQMNGIIIVPMNQPIPSQNAIDRHSTLTIASLDSTYKHMHQELEAAIAAFDRSGSKSFTTSNAAYFPSLCMTYTLQARLFLEQGYYKNNQEAFNAAFDAAQNALDNLPQGAEKDLVGDGQKFLEQYRSISAPTKEDILTVNFTTSDNLSANSINNMFNSYGATVSQTVREDLFYNGTNDIRKNIYKESQETPGLEMYSSCGKYPNQNQINNVPVIRVPELYLIQAEARANMTDGDVDDPGYQEAMLKTLGVRDTSIHGDYDKLKELYFKNAPATGRAAAIHYVLDERRREFAGEGHRWFDMRRTGTPLSHAGNKDFRISFTNYPIQAFAFPIPESETNTGAWQNGKLTQNEFWNEKNGDSWSPRYDLPIDGGVYGN